ncbi:hydrogen peroxide-inducible genes activator [bacterium]|nr:hydrogen peroxide-inducible genes activator [bacterium]
MISMSQVEYILAVARTGHFGKAARECHISQPSLSSQIQKAEIHFGVTLFDRSTKPVTVTEAGQPIIDHAMVLMDDYQQFVTATARQTPLSGTFHLGTIPTIAPYLLPMILPTFSKTYPHIQLTVSIEKTHTLLEMMDSHRLDAAILATEHDDHRLHQDPVGSDPFWVVSSDPDILSHSTVTPDLLHTVPLWLLDDGHCFRDQVIDMCHLDIGQQGLPNVQFRGGSLETLMHLIQNGIGTTLIPEMAIRFLPANTQTAIRPLAAPTPARTIRISRRSKNPKRSIAAIFHTLCHDAMTAPHGMG